MQISSRLLLVHLICTPFPNTIRASPFYPSMLLAWSLTEVIRYSYFCFLLSPSNSLGAQAVPPNLSWLRYNTFFVLYPLGIVSECALVYAAIEPAGMVYGVAAKVGLWVVLGVYVPGSWVLYSHMMTQRRRVMKGKAKEG